MRNTHGKDLLRAQVNSSWLYRVFNIVFVVLFAVIVLLAIFNNPGTLYPSNFLMLLAAAAAGTLVIFLLSRLFSAIPRPGAAVERVVVILLLVVLFVGMVYIGRALLPGMDASSDYGKVFLAARDFVNGKPGADEYFQLYPRNAGLYVLWCGFFRVLSQFGMTSFAFPAMILNAAAITASVLLLFLCVRRMFGPNKSLFVLVGAFFTLPFVAGAALPCAETLILPIPIAAVMLWLRARSLWRKGEIKGAVIRTCVASALLGVGALFKMAVLVVWVALALDLLILLCGKGRLRLLLVSFLSMAVVFVALSAAFWLSPLLPTFSMSGRVPEAGYVMSGMADPGQGAADLEQLEDEDGAARRTAYAAEEMGDRVREMGAGGFVVHLLDKLAFLFGDGTYSLGGEYEKAESSVFRAIFASGGAWFHITAYAAFAILAGTMVWMVVGALKSIFRGNDAFTFLRVAIFGLMLFLLLWDGGPRSLISLLPLVILCALEAAPVPQARRPQPSPEDLPPAEDGAPARRLPGGRPDYMDPSFGLVRDEEGRVTRQEPENVGAMPPAEYVTVPTERLEPPPPDPAALPSPQQPPLPGGLPQGTLWDYMEEE